MDMSNGDDDDLDDVDFFSGGGFGHIFGDFDGDEEDDSAEEGPGFPETGTAPGVGPLAPSTASDSRRYPVIHGQDEIVLPMEVDPPQAAVAPVDPPTLLFTRDTPLPQNVIIVLFHEGLDPSLQCLVRAFDLAPSTAQRTMLPLNDARKNCLYVAIDKLFPAILTRLLASSRTKTGALVNSQDFRKQLLKDSGYVKCPVAAEISEGGAGEAGGGCPPSKKVRKVTSEFNVYVPVTALAAKLSLLRLCDDAHRLMLYLVKFNLEIFEECNDGGPRPRIARLMNLFRKSNPIAPAPAKKFLIADSSLFHRRIEEPAGDEAGGGDLPSPIARSTSLSSLLSFGGVAGSVADDQEILQAYLALAPEVRFQHLEPVISWGNLDQNLGIAWEILAQYCSTTDIDKSMLFQVLLGANQGAERFDLTSLIASASYTDIVLELQEASRVLLDGAVSTNAYQRLMKPALDKLFNKLGLDLKLVPDTKLNDDKAQALSGRGIRFSASVYMRSEVDLKNKNKKIDEEGSGSDSDHDSENDEVAGPAAAPFAAQIDAQIDAPAAGAGVAEVPNEAIYSIVAVLATDHVKCIQQPFINDFSFAEFIHERRTFGVRNVNAPGAGLQVCVVVRLLLTTDAVMTVANSFNASKNAVTTHTLVTANLDYCRNSIDYSAAIVGITNLDDKLPLSLHIYRKVFDSFQSVNNMVFTATSRNGEPLFFVIDTGTSPNDMGFSLKAARMQWWDKTYTYFTTYWGKIVYRSLLAAVCANQDECHARTISVLQVVRDRHEAFEIAIETIGPLPLTNEVFSRLKLAIALQLPLPNCGDRDPSLLSLPILSAEDTSTLPINLSSKYPNEAYPVSMLPPEHFHSLQGLVKHFFNFLATMICNVGILQPANPLSTGEKILDDYEKHLTLTGGRKAGANYSFGYRLRAGWRKLAGAAKHSLQFCVGYGPRILFQPNISSMSSSCTLMCSY